MTTTERNHDMGRGSSGGGRVSDHYKPRGQSTHGQGARRRRKKGSVAETKDSSGKTDETTGKE